MISKYKVGDKIEFTETSYAIWGYPLTEYKNKGAIITKVKHDDEIEGWLYAMDNEHHFYGESMIAYKIDILMDKLQAFMTKNNITEEDAITMLEWHKK